MRAAPRSVRPRRCHRFPRLRRPRTNRWHDGRVHRLVLLASLVVACAHDEPTLPIPVGDEAAPLDVTSDAFDDGAAIPKQFTCSGDGISPPLAWSEGPEGTLSFALVVDDPDAPKKV